VSRIALCTDSSALLPARAAERLGVTVVPIAITLDGAAFEESDDAIDDFYARLSEGARATTSQPSPGEFREAYERAAAAGAGEVLSIHLDARISGTVRSAELAARDSSIPATVVDTTTASFGVGLCVRAAASMLARGFSASKAAEEARSLGRKLRNAFVAYAGPHGRLPDTSGWSLLQFGDGAIEPVAAGVGLGDAIEVLAGRVSAEDADLRAAVGHAGVATEPAADALALALEGLAQVVSVERYRVGAAVGAHTGSLTFGAFWWPLESRIW
jgi:fatty acid-binding protein DegV